MAVGDLDLYRHRRLPLPPRGLRRGPGGVATGGRRPGRPGQSLRPPAPGTGAVRVGPARPLGRRAGPRLHGRRFRDLRRRGSEVLGFHPEQDAAAGLSVWSKDLDRRSRTGEFPGLRGIRAFADASHEEQI